MSKKDRGRKSLSRIRLVQVFMIIGYALIVVASVTIVTRLAVKKTDEVLKNKVLSLTSSLNVQMKLNMDGYISRMENIATLAFGEQSAYSYDASDPNNDEYESINTEKVITDKLYSLCIMENFVDYGIVYSNNRTVGKISNATSALFGDKIFSELYSMITRPRTDDGWFTGYGGDFKRIYYVKKVHEHAVLVISFYSHELEQVFDNPETLSDMKVRLVNQDYDILYSEDNSEIGNAVPESIRIRIRGQSSASFMDDDYLISVNKSGDWYVICSIPTDVILAEKNEMTRYIYMTGLAATLAAVLVGFYLSYLLTNPVKKMVGALDTKAKNDLLTGLLNKLTFEEYSANCLERSLDSENRALVIIDLDNFKGINDSYGHAKGDKVLADTGEMMRRVFSDDDYLGRIGGDEFCVLINKRIPDKDAFRSYVAERCTELTERFTEISESDGCKVSASIGAAFFPDDGRGFTELYAAGDKALYISKEQGKDRFSFYDDTKKEGGRRP